MTSVQTKQHFTPVQENRAAAEISNIGHYGLILVISECSHLTIHRILSWYFPCGAINVLTMVIDPFDITTGVWPGVWRKGYSDVGVWQTGHCEVEGEAETLQSQVSNTLKPDVDCSVVFFFNYTIGKAMANYWNVTTVQ